jgi:hypothetical protein
MLEISSQPAQAMLLAGMVLMGWMLIRRQIVARRRQHKEDRTGSDFVKQLSRADAPAGVPLASAPPETQRWQAEMLQLQRELKAELDMKVAVVNALLRQADEKINQLAALKQK